MVGEFALAYALGPVGMRNKSIVVSVPATL
jgi:hypothetical protein